MEHISPRDYWLFGDFPEAVRRIKSADIGIKHLCKKTFVPDPHYHTDSEEFNYVISGKLRANRKEVHEGEMFIFKPNEVCNIQLIEDVTLLVVRLPSAPNDKVIVDVT